MKLLLFAVFPISERALLYVRVLRRHPLLKATIKVSIKRWWNDINLLAPEFFFNFSTPCI